MSRPLQLDPDRPRHRIERRPDADPDPKRLVAAVARAILEVETGRRPLSQLDPLLSPAVLGRLSRWHDRARRDARQLRAPLIGPGAIAVVKVITQRPHDDAIEAVALVRRGTRLLPLAMRVERWRGGWRVVELARPDEVGATTCHAPVPACGTGA